MASINYNVGVSTTQGVQALQNLQNKLQQTSSAFSGLKSAIAGIATAGFIASLYQSAAALKDVSDASGIGVQQLLGFQKAVKQFGGDSQGALDGVSKFAQAIDGAASGSKSLQDRLLQLGITLTDLKTLSEEELLLKVVKSLGEGENGAAKMAAAIEIFGKKFKNVNFRDVAANIDAMTASQTRAAAATEAADRAEEAFGNTVSKFRSELLILLKPISEVATAFLNMGGIINGLIKIVLTLGAAIITFTALGKVVTWGAAAFTSLSVGVKTLTTGFATGGAHIRNFGLYLENLKLASLGGKFKILTLILGTFGSWILKNIPAIAALGIALSGLWDILGDGINAIKEYLGFGKSQSDQAKAQAEEEKKRAAALREVTDAYAKQRLEINRVSENFASANANIINAINVENQLIGQSKLFGDTLKAQEDLYKRGVDEINKLRDAKEQLTAEEKRAGLGANYDQQIAKIQQLTEAEAKRLERVIENQNRLQSLEQLRLYGIRTEIDLTNQLQTIQDTMAKSTMSEIEKRYYDIEAAAKASAKAAIEAEEARVGRKLGTEEVRAYYAAALKGSAELKKATDEEYKSSRLFETGWKQAFNDYVDNATNAAEQAKRAFQSFTQGMEDMLMKFFETGKLNWKDFVQSMVQTLLRSQLQQAMANIFSMGVGTSGGGGLFSGLGKLLGFANGGIIPTNGPVIVGERGPEILSGASGRVVTPNSSLGGLGGQSVTYNINAVDAMSFKQMIARDPAFIHAVASQGGRTIPGRA